MRIAIVRDVARRCEQPVTPLLMVSSLRADPRAQIVNW
jgi:hypothetical protein